MNEFKRRKKVKIKEHNAKKGKRKTNKKKMNKTE